MTNRIRLRAAVFAWPDIYPLCITFQISKEITGHSVLHKVLEYFDLKVVRMIIISVAYKTAL